MAKTYRPNRLWRPFNLLVCGLLWLGLFPAGTYVLTVPGRRSGRPHSTPVTLVEEGGERWLVAPYGAVDWVRNARVAGRVALSRGRHTETVGLAELGPAESAPILKRYVARVPHTQAYFDATPTAPPEAFLAEAPRHPAFRIVGLVADG
jgi:deazaflavin-dependent oxidoreductase (nitroreductase family)